MLKLVVMAGTRINRTWHISILSFLSLHTCRTCKRLSKTIINRTWHISMRPYPYPAIMFQLKGMVENY